MQEPDVQETVKQVEEATPAGIAAEINRRGDLFRPETPEEETRRLVVAAQQAEQEVVGVIGNVVTDCLMRAGIPITGDLQRVVIGLVKWVTEQASLIGYHKGLHAQDAFEKGRKLGQEEGRTWVCENPGDYELRGIP